MLVGMLAAAAGQHAFANTAWPHKAIKIVVPGPAGSGGDIFARLLLPSLQSTLKESLFVENKAGANGIIGNDNVAKAQPDGYTVLFSPSSSISINPIIQPKMPYDTARDLVPVAQIGVSGILLVANPALGIKTLADMVKYAKANPGKVRVGNSGAGSIWHIAASALEINQKVQFNHIPFEGAAPAVTALMGKHIEAVTVNSGEVKAGVDAGKLKILAVMTPERDPAFPKVPTMIESGVKLEFVGWGGFAVAKGTPKPIVATLSAALKKAASTDDFKNFITSRGMIVKYRNPEEFKPFVDSQYVFFNDLLSKMELGK